jgi:hypothetical protein
VGSATAELFKTPKTFKETILQIKIIRKLAASLPQIKMIPTQYTKFCVKISIAEMRCKYRNVFSAVGGYNYQKSQRS